MTQVRPREAQQILESMVVARYQMYPEYRDTGIEWLGQIPSHWKIERLKYATNLNPEVLSENTHPDYLIEYVDISNVNALGEILEVQEYRFEDAPSRARRVVRQGDTIISTVRTYLKAIAFLENPSENLIVSTGFAVLRPKPNLHPKFLAYVVQAVEFIDTVVANSTGVSYPAIAPSRLGDLPIWFPVSIDEQRAIAAFLDRQTAKIDALIAKKRELIAALHEKRSAIISHAVTKGLNPDAPMKDSGIEWLGEIPAGWRVVKIKYLAQLGNGSTPLRDNEEYWHEGTFPWITSTFVNDDAVGEPTQFVTERALRECHLPIVRPQSVLVAITGQGKTRGMAAVLHYEATINQHLVYISPRSDLLLSEFLHLFLSSVYDILRIISEGAGSTRGALTVEQIANFAVFLPPVSEQWDIVKYISEHTAEIDAMTAKITETIERLQEYRSALISAAVTGRIDVRGA